MVHHIVQNYTGKQFRTIKQLVSQIAGRRPGQMHYDFRIPREMQDRRQKNLFKLNKTYSVPNILSVQFSSSPNNQVLF